jgi:hypothetical protein
MEVYFLARGIRTHNLYGLSHVKKSFFEIHCLLGFIVLRGSPDYVQAAIHNYQTALGSKTQENGIGKLDITKSGVKPDLHKALYAMVREC